METALRQEREAEAQELRDALQQLLTDNDGNTENAASTTNSELKSVSINEEATRQH